MGDAKDLQNAPTARDSTVHIDVELPSLPAIGYEHGEVIGRGGMGEIIAVRDLRIGRDVALKRMHASGADPNALRRFLREARIQARLDHPAIVPVHELGTDDAGRLYFTMKRITGVTLAERLSSDAPTPRLLRVLVDVCHAVELAHARGVVHRDLKPSNIMLGPYGEVYVLDWGIARIVVEDRASSEPSTLDDVDTLSDDTATGALLGTPGYMAPEQVRGAAATPAADVYAIGAIMFEILTREPLHPRGAEAIGHTLSHPRILPSSRIADVAPELDRLCGDALADEPGERPSIHDIAERLQAYLDGDRDLAQRRALACDQVSAARDALAQGDRATALRAAGRALALDQESQAAAEIVTKLLVEPPAVLPDAIKERIAEAERLATFSRINKAGFAFLSPFLLVVALPFLDVRGWSWLVALFVTLLVVALRTIWTARRTGQTSLPFLMVGLLVASALWSRLAGPLMLMPVLVCGVLVALASQTKMIGRPKLLLAWGVVAILLPFALEALGVMPTSITAVDGGLFTRSTVFGGGPFDYPLVVAANLMFILVVGYYASHLGTAAALSQRKLQIQAWHLEQLVPLRRS